MASEGTVKDANGKLLPNADIKIEAKDGGSGIEMVKTNASGHYSCNGLPAAGIYRVSLLVNGTVKASITNLKMTPSMPIQQLNFDLKKETAATDLGEHWIEVEDGADAGPDTNRVYQIKGTTIHP